VRCLSLFSGIGGLDLGLEQAGIEIVGQSEIDPFACEVLAKHWPTVPNLGDITQITEEDLERLGTVDLVAGGFPCTDTSLAGKRAGLDGDRSGLVYDMARLVCMVRPRPLWLMENVSGLLARDMGDLLELVASCGYSAAWDCIPASALCAPHRRDRLFVCAWPEGSSPLAHAPGERMERSRAARLGISRPSACKGLPRRGGTGGCRSHWQTQPELGRLAHGLSSRLARPRLKALGNAVVPQVGEFVGRHILDLAEAVSGPASLT